MSSFNASKILGSSKYLTIETFSLSPFLLLVLIINSLAKSWVGAGSSKDNFIFLSKGSPGNNSHWSKTLRQNAYPLVWTLKSVSKPKESMAGIWALTV